MVGALKFDLFVECKMCIRCRGGERGGERGVAFGIRAWGLVPHGRELKP